MTSPAVSETRNEQAPPPRELPRLRGPRVTLRELTAADAPSLLEHICTPVVARYLATPPQSVEAFRDFINWTHAQHGRGRHMCIGVVPPDRDQAVGFIQVWPIESHFSTAEWGFAVGAGYWGTGLFAEAAELLLPFVFETMGVVRLEARCAALNARGQGALAKLGARPEGLLRGGCRHDGTNQDHVMWSILADEWQARTSPSRVFDGGAR